jgi:ABC-type glycerol-3-phosphate transport system permease component
VSRAAWWRGAALGVGLVALALPFVWALLGSLLPEARLYAGGLPDPGDLTLAHYRALFAEQDFWLPLRNSCVVAGATTTLSLVVAALAAYALARLRFRGRGFVLGGILVVSLFPQISLVPPLYLLLRRLGLLHSYPGLVLPYLTFSLPLSVWLLTGYLRELPREVEEAARLDGAGPLRTLVEVVVPMALPALAATGILTFVYCWNEFLFALSFTLGPERQTLPVAIALFRGQYQIPWGQVLAASVLATLPVAVLVLAFERRIVRGLTTGAVKG